MKRRTTLIMLFIFSMSAIALASVTTAERIISDINNRKHTEYTVFATSDVLTLQKGEDKMQYAMPEDKFYLAVAPYINNTHPCAIHYLSGCISEMRNKTFNVTVTARDGSIIYNNEVQTLENGFFELWLPRDLTAATIQVEYQGRKATAKISTQKGDPTCLTTPLKLI